MQEKVFFPRFHDPAPVYNGGVNELHSLVDRRRHFGRSILTLTLTYTKRSIDIDIWLLCLPKLFVWLSLRLSFLRYAPLASMKHK